MAAKPTLTVPSSLEAKILPILWQTESATQEDTNGKLTRIRASGQGLVEYALILVLIAVVVIGTLTLLGAQTSQVYDHINCALSGGTYHADQGNGHSNRCQ